VRTNRGVVPALLLAAAAVATAGRAHAQTVPVDGSRAVTLATAGTLTADRASGTLRGSLSVNVTETAKVGGNWEVTVRSSVLAPLVTSHPSLAARNLVLTGAPKPPSAPQGCLRILNACTWTAGAGGPLDSERVLFKVTGQSPSTPYTGVYSATGGLTLSVPNGTAAETYNGTITVTLYQ
jgi:hypothetical protein